MNSALCTAVQAIAQGRGVRWSAAVILAFALGVGSCVQVDGGAIELSWTLRTFDGDVIDSNREQACRRARIEDIRVCWRAAGAPVDAADARLCGRSSSRRFFCGADRGVTQFEVPPGATSIWIEPICASGQPPQEGTFQVPAPIVREIRDGEVAALRALLVVATDGDQNCPEAGCTCAP